MANLKNIDIKGYRSIKNASVELRQLNVMIGANGAGKSNLISFLKLLNEMMAGRLQEYIGKSGRGQSALHFGPKTTPQLEAILQFEDADTYNTYYMRLVHAANDILLFADESLDYRREGWHSLQRPPMSLGAGHAESKIAEYANQGNTTAKVFQHILNECRVYHFHDTSPGSAIRQYCYTGDVRWLRPEAGNLAAILYGVQDAVCSDQFARVLGSGWRSWEVLRFAK